MLRYTDFHCVLLQVSFTLGGNIQYVSGVGGETLKFYRFLLIYCVI